MKHTVKELLQESLNGNLSLVLEAIEDAEAETETAVAAEREACAAILEEELGLVPEDGTVDTKFYRRLLRHFAGRIRARGAKCE